MTTPTSDALRVQISQVARWRMARNLIAVYSEIAQRTGVSSPPSTSFGADDRAETLDAVEKWFDSVDKALPVADFRSALASVTASNGESGLHAVAQHFMTKRRLDDESRKKLEFVLVQYFLISSPPSFHAKTISVRDVGEVLHPLLGDVGGAPASAAEIEQLGTRLQNCSTVRELYDIVTAMESCKQAMGVDYYNPAMLVSITHAQYLLRLAARNVVRNAVEETVRQLEQLRARGTKVLDCRAAGASEHEPVDGLILTWKGLGEADIEYRIAEFAPALLALEKVLAEAGGGSSPQLAQELASLRSITEQLSAQLTAITQRVQRLEILVPSPGSTSAVEPVKWPSTPAGIPIAMRTAPSTDPASVSAVPDIRPIAPVPQNGKPQH